MATVVTITHVRKPCLEIIFFVRFHRRSPDKPQPARPLLDNTPEDILANTWITKGGAEQSRRAAFGLRARTRLGRPPQAIRDVCSTASHLSVSDRCEIDYTRPWCQVFDEEYREASTPCARGTRQSGRHPSKSFCSSQSEWLKEASHKRK